MRTLNVYQLWRCEEYWMEDDYGIYATKERAEKQISVDSLREELTRVERDGITIFVRHPRGETFDMEDLTSYAFRFYKISHRERFSIWGIFEVEVIE